MSEKLQGMFRVKDLTLIDTDILGMEIAFI
jgi:hypothetical protein